jgi:PIN domain nuclease of toxin-antitoxin system
LGQPAALTLEARDAIEDGRNDVLVGAASTWEVTIKRATGKLDISGDLSSEIEKAAFMPLPITIAHSLVAGELPPHHRDPFDRMLIAQAQLDGLTVVTRDPRFAAYGISIPRA